MGPIFCVPPWIAPKIIETSKPHDENNVDIQWVSAHLFKERGSDVIFIYICVSFLSKIDVPANEWCVHVSHTARVSPQSGDCVATDMRVNWCVLFTFSTLSRKGCSGYTKGIIKINNWYKYQFCRGPEAETVSLSRYWKCLFWYVFQCIHQIIYKTKKK